MGQVVLRFCGEEERYLVYCDGVEVGHFCVPNELRFGALNVDFSVLEDLGRGLGEVLFGGCPSLVELIRGLSGDSSLVLEFDDDAEDLLNLPWEFLRHPDFDRPLSLEFPFIRRIGEVKELKPIDGRPLKVLVVICEPLTVGEFGCRRFHDVIVEETKRFVDSGLLQLEFLSLPSTPDKFSRRIFRDCPDVVHFIGHGNIGVLWFEKENGDTVKVDAEGFYGFFKGAEKPRLVILTACYSGAVVGEDLVSGTATALLEAGISSVLAMQVPAGIESAYRLIGDLYSGLLRVPFDELVRKLRASRFLSRELHLPAQWGIPVLYIQCESGRLFEGLSKGDGHVKPWPSPSPAFGLEEPQLFVGRKKYLVEINEKLRKGKVVALEGLSGIGKSFLAKKICPWYRNRGVFEGGIVWVKLSESFRGFDDVIGRIGEILGVSRGLLLNRLELMPTLVVLDNYEHVVKDEKLAEFLMALPGRAKALLTSVEPVGFGEIVGVDVMELPEAVEYFSRCADNSGWDGRNGGECVPLICKELSCIPLCIELVAPKASELSLDNLLEMVRKELRVVRDERRLDLPKRQRSIEAALRISYEGLGSPEQRLFAIMCVFAGGIFPEFLAEVSEHKKEDTLMLLKKLCDVHLVSFDEQRYHLHSIVRRFARERLEKEFKEQEKYEEKFADVFLALCGLAEEALDKGGNDAKTAAAMALMEEENLLSAQTILFERKKLKECFALSVVLDDLFERAGLSQSRIIAVHTALKTAQQQNDMKRIVLAFNNLGLAYEAVGSLRDALDYLEKALNFSQKIDDKLGMANAYGAIGIVLSQLGKPKEALEHYQKALKIDRQIGNKLGTANAYGNIGNNLFELGKPKEALEHYQKALKIDRQIGNKLGTANDYHNIGLILDRMDAFEEAFMHFLKAAYIFHKINSPSEQKALQQLDQTLQKITPQQLQKTLPKIPKRLKNYLKQKFTKK